MIVNPYSVTALTIDSLSVVLATVTLVKTKEHLFRRTGPGPDTGEQYTMRENQRYLLFCLGESMLVIRLFSYPFFYLVMASFVGKVDGAMCIYGATKLFPGLTLFLEVIKPLLFFLGGVWIMLFGLERMNQGGLGQADRPAATMLILLLGCAGLTLVEAGGSIVLWLRASAELAVSCCTTITDIPSRFTVWIPEAILGPDFVKPLWYGYFGFNGLMLLLGGVGWFRVSRGKAGVLMFTLLSCLAICCGGITLLAMIELVAPGLMGLSFHHCIYCFVQDVLDGALILGLVMFGTFGFLALLPVFLLARSWTERRRLDRVLSWLLGLGMIGLSGSLLMVSIHLLF